MDKIYKDIVYTLTQPHKQILPESCNIFYEDLWKEIMKTKQTDHGMEIYTHSDAKKGK